MQRHALNTDFAWRASSGPRRRLTDAQARQYDQQGYFLLEGVFSAGELAAVAEAIDPMEREGEEILRRRHGGKTFIARADAITFTIHLVKRSAVLKEFSQHPVFRDIAHDTLGPGARLYWDQAVYKKPGNPEEFPWHQDNGYTFTEPQQYLTCWVPLNDATLENGCPWVAPGLHRMGTLLHELTPLGLECLKQPAEVVAVPAKAGDVVVFSSLTPHRTGPNLTAETRKSYILQYAPDGAVVHETDGRSALANDPERQFYVDPL
jgi:phytanoyl-CoA hydroxylase